eukprot:gene36785-47962_t
MAAKKSFDYSKWDNIELSDDESDLHPNIDKESWFRMKHRTRVEREAKEDEEIKALAKQNEADEARLSIIRARLANLKSGTPDEDAEFEDMDALQGEADELQSNIDRRKNREHEFLSRRAWNIDNICKVTEERSVVNDHASKSLRAEDFAPTGVTENNLASKSSPPPAATTSSTASLPTPPTDKPKATSTSSSAASPAAATPPLPPSSATTVAVPRAMAGPVERMF